MEGDVAVRVGGLEVDPHAQSVSQSGKAIVIMDKTDYTCRIMLILEDEKYSPLSCDQTVKVENKLRAS